MFLERRDHTRAFCARAACPRARVVETYRLSIPGSDRAEEEAGSSFAHLQTPVRHSPGHQHDFLVSLKGEIRKSKVPLCACNNVFADSTTAAKADPITICKSYHPLPQLPPHRCFTARFFGDRTSWSRMPAI